MVVLGGGLLLTSEVPLQSTERQSTHQDQGLKRDLSYYKYRLARPREREVMCTTPVQGYLAHKSSKVVHQSSSFQDLSSWIPMKARGNIRVSQESRDGDDFHSFCQSVMQDAGRRLLKRDKVVGSITVRFFTRALNIRQQWSLQLSSHDDTVAISGIVFVTFSAGTTQNPEP